MKKNQSGEGKKPISPEESGQRNSDQQGVDKAPGEERGKQHKTSRENLKGKKVDADPSQESDRPAKASKARSFCSTTAPDQPSVQKGFLAFTFHRYGSVRGKNSFINARPAINPPT